MRISGRRVPGWRLLLCSPLVLALSLVLAADEAPELPSDASGDQPIPCADLEGVEALLEPGTVVVFGEIHGTVEAPALVADVVCHALRQKLSVTVALEIPRHESSRVEDWLASAGGEADRDALLDGDFWQSAYQDGRRSEAMLALLDEARRFSVAGLPIVVRLLDQQGLGGAEREEAMAQAMIDAATETGSDLVVALVGNLHARLARGVPISEPMALRAAARLESRRLLALRMSSAGGEAWLCLAGQASCGPGSIAAGDDTERRFLRFATEPERGYHGVFHLGAIHASPPAVPELAGPRNLGESSDSAQKARRLDRPAAVDRPRSEPRADGEWPQWMGPSGNGTIDVGLLPLGAGVGLTVDWRQPVGRGYSSITVSRGHAVTLEADAIGLRLIALDVMDGGEIWQVPLVDAGSSASERLQSPLSTPSTDGERVYALSAEGQLFAVALDDGEVLWTRDLARDFSASLPSYGMSTAPLFDGERLWVQVGGRGGHLAAFDPKTGETLKSLNHAEVGSYATPVDGVLAGQRQLIIPGGDRIYAVRHEDGGLLWDLEGLSFPDRDPILIGDRDLFFTFQEYAAMLQVSRDDGGWHVRELWRSQQLDSSYSPAVHHQGAIFGFDGGFLTCLDAANGEVAWEARSGSGSLIRVDDHLVVFRVLQGKLELVEAVTDRHVVAASTAVFPGGVSSTTPPSFGAGRIFLRDAREIVAVRLDATAQPIPENEFPFGEPFGR